MSCGSTPKLSSGAVLVIGGGSVPRSLAAPSVRFGPMSQTNMPLPLAAGPGSGRRASAGPEVDGSRVSGMPVGVERRLRSGAPIVRASTSVATLATWWSP